jgi:nucleotide-binding universal stress UspA family protein
MIYCGVAKMFKKILIATDGSKPSMKAAKAGVDLASLTGGKVTALYVADKGRILDNIDEDGVDLAKDVRDGTRLGLQKEGHLAVQSVEELAKAQGVGFEAKVVVGYPAEAIIKNAEENNIDAIVIASIGRTGISRFLLGSVAEKVVRNSKTPVILIPGA